MVLPIGEPEADAIAVASEECERREPVCQPPWKLTQLSSASTVGLQQATNQRLHAAAAPLRSALHCLQRQKAVEEAVQEGLTRTFQLGEPWQGKIGIFSGFCDEKPLYALMNGPIEN